MERLTEKGHVFNSNQLRDIDRWSIAQCLNRLSEYENIGLMPEEVQKLHEKTTARIPDRAEYDTEFTCPGCGEVTDDYDVRAYKFCPECGQALKFE